MITQEDQLELFKIISKEIKKDVSCYAFGGTSMMFYGYKDETKDIDIVFADLVSRDVFIEAIKKIGFQETSPMKVYIPEKLRDKNRPLMFKRDDYRFDLFAEKIIHTILSPGMKNDTYAIHEFRGKQTLKINVMKKEHIVQLKSATERQNDFDDIRRIVERDKSFDWQYLINETIWQHLHGDTWALLDIEKMLKELKNYVMIEQKYFRQLHNLAAKKK